MVVTKMDSKWSFPKFNRRGVLPARRIILRDITLREGEQASDMAFSENDKVKVARSLAAAGVQEIECGFATSAADRRVVRALKSEGCRAALELMNVGYLPDWREQIMASLESGVDLIHFIFRSDYPHLRMLGLNRKQAIDRVAEIATYAKSLGAQEISFAPTFASRADPKFLVDLINTGVQAGVTQVEIPDSTGVMNPEGYGFLVARVKKSCKIPVAVHCHNDFGLALANTLQGLQSGAEIVEASLGGFGERAGVAAIEEVAMALEFLYGVRLRVDLKLLTDAAIQLFRMTKKPIPPLKPIIGSNAFAQKLDIHVMVTKTQPWLHEPFDPNAIGMKRRLVVGKGSGPAAVKEKARELSLSVAEDRVREIVSRVNRFAEKHKRSLTEAEFREIIRDSQGCR